MKAFQLLPDSDSHNPCPAVMLTGADVSLSPTSGSPPVLLPSFRKLDGSTAYNRSYLGQQCLKYTCHPFSSVCTSSLCYFERSKGLFPLYFVYWNKEGTNIWSFQSNTEIKSIFFGGKESRCDTQLIPRLNFGSKWIAIKDMLRASWFCRIDITLYYCYLVEFVNSFSLSHWATG